MWTCIIMTCVGFVSGSIMYSYFLPKWIYHVDTRSTGADGNPGGANAIAATGKRLGLLCMFLDVFKAFLPVFASVAWLGIRGFYLAPVMAAPVLGHVFSPLLRFRGGKAVSASFGSLLGAVTISGALGILIISMLIVKFVVVVNPDSAKVIAAFMVASIMVWLTDADVGSRIGMSVISLTVCAKHFINPNYGDLGVSVGPLHMRLNGQHIGVTKDG